MRLRVIAVGTRMPGWVNELVEDYTTRLGPKLKLSVVEVQPGPRRAGQSSDRAVSVEGERLLAALRRDEFVTTLDERGKELTTKELAVWLGTRMQEGRDLAFIIGGPDGLAPEVLARSDFKWSLSRLTFPHPLVRVIVAEQLYRAHSVLVNHPYHRE